MSVKNVDIPLDPLTRATKGGGAIPRPPINRRRRRGILFGFCIRDIYDGINIAIRIWRWEKIVYLWRYPKPEFVKAPEMAYPEMLTEVPTGKIFDVEDMDKEPEPIKLIEPEDM